MIKVLLFFLTINLCVYGQNLVLNSDFENRFSCPNYYGNNTYCYVLDSNIYSWNGTLSFIGYLNSCVDVVLPAESDRFYDIPQSGLGYQFAHSGEGYIGVYAFQTGWYRDLIPPWPEYSYCTDYYYSGYGWQHLQNPLQVGKKYYAEYYANLGDTSLYARKKIGMCFTENAPRFEPIGMTSETWQLVNDTVDLTDKENWKHLQWIFEADSAYNYLQIGPASRCVGPDDTTYVGGNPTYLGLTVAFYFVDDVGLYQIQGSSSTQTFCGNTATLSTPAGSFNHIWSNGGRAASTTISGSGTYTVFYRIDSLAISDTINVEFVPTIAENFLGADTVLLVPQSTISLSGPAGYSYSWNTGSTVRTLDVTAPGTYWLTVTDENGCMTTDTVAVVFDTSVGINNFWKNTDIQIYPNPAKENINIKSTEPNCTIEIYARDGKMVLHHKLVNSLTINVAEWQQGIYYVKFYSEHGTKIPMVRKVVIQK
jgi:hypothetical protein